MKQVRTWRNAVVEINRNVRSGKPACMWVKNDSVVVSDQPNLKTAFEFVTYFETSKKELKSDILDLLSRALWIQDNAAVVDIVIMLKIIEGGECCK